MRLLYPIIKHQIIFKIQHKLLNEKYNFSYIYNYLFFNYYSIV